MKRAISAIGAAIGFIGMFLVLGSAGASDCGEMPFCEAATLSCIGAVLVAISIGIQKKIAACAGTQTTTRK